MPAKSIPVTEQALLLRTDFSNEGAWADVCREARARYGPFVASVDCVSDPAFDGLRSDQVVDLLPPRYPHAFVFLADARTLDDAEHPILVLDLMGEARGEFRVIPSHLWGVENNLSIGNMDFEEFADSADEDGVFRGF